MYMYMHLNTNILVTEVIQTCLLKPIEAGPVVQIVCDLVLLQI